MEYALARKGLMLKLSFDSKCYGVKNPTVYVLDLVYHNTTGPTGPFTYCGCLYVLNTSVKLPTLLHNMTKPSKLPESKWCSSMRKQVI